MKKQNYEHCAIKGCRNKAFDTDQNFPMPMCKKHLKETKEMFEETAQQMMDKDRRIILVKHNK